MESIHISTMWWCDGLSGDKYYSVCVSSVEKIGRFDVLWELEWTANMDWHQFDSVRFYSKTDGNIHKIHGVLGAGEHSVNVRF